MLAEDNNFHRRLTQALCQDMGVMENKLTDATQKSIRERLALALLKLGDSYGVDGGNKQRLDIALTREEIAGIVGTATETVIRLLSEFKKDKLIDLQGKKFSCWTAKDWRGFRIFTDSHSGLADSPLMCVKFNFLNSTSAPSA